MWTVGSCRVVYSLGVILRLLCYDVDFDPEATVIMDLLEVSEVAHHHGSAVLLHEECAEELPVQGHNMQARRGICMLCRQTSSVNELLDTAARALVEIPRHSNLPNQAQHLWLVARKMIIRSCRRVAGGVGGRGTVACRGLKRLGASDNKPKSRSKQRQQLS